MIGQSYGGNYLKYLNSGNDFKTKEEYQNSTFYKEMIKLREILDRKVEKFVQVVEEGIKIYDNFKKDLIEGQKSFR